MKLMQTPSLITGAILGASLITLSAASNDSALGGLNVFVPGTEVSSADVNANFTYLDDEVTTLEGRMDNLEGSSVSEEYISGHYAPGMPGIADVLRSFPNHSPPAGKQIRITSTSVYQTGDHMRLMVKKPDGSIQVIAQGGTHDFNTGFILREGDVLQFEFYYSYSELAWCGVLEDA